MITTFWPLICQSAFSGCVGIRPSEQHHRIYTFREKLIVLLIDCSCLVRGNDAKVPLAKISLTSESDFTYTG